MLYQIPNCSLEYLESALKMVIFLKLLVLNEQLLTFVKFK